MERSAYNPLHSPPPSFKVESNFVSNQNPYNPGQKKKRTDPEKVIAQTNAINELHNAVSELEFNRVQYAKEAIRKALSMIDRFQD